MILFQWLCNLIKNLNNRESSQIGCHALILGLKSKIITFPSKTHFNNFQFEHVFHDVANEKNNKPFESRKIGSYTGILNKRVF